MFEKYYIYQIAATVCVLNILLECGTSAWFSLVPLENLCAPSQHFVYCLHTYSGIAKNVNWGPVLSFLSFHFLSFLLLFPFLPFFLSLEVGPLNFSYEVCGSAVSFPLGSGTEPRLKSNLVQLSPYNVTSGGNNFV